MVVTISNTYCTVTVTYIEKSLEMGKASKSSRKASKAQKANKDEQNEDDVEREECFLCQQPSDGKTCSDCGIAQVGIS